MKTKGITISLTFFFLLSALCFGQQSDDTGEGRKKFDDGDFKGAIEVFEKYIEGNKVSKNILTSAKVDYSYQLNGISRFYLCDFQNSIRVFNDLLARADYSKDLQYTCNLMLGYIEYVQKKYPAAIEFFNKAISCTKKNDEAVLLKSISYLKLSNPSEANIGFNFLISQKKNSLVKSKAIFYSGDHQAGINSLKELIVDDPSMSNYYELASLYAFTKNNAEALYNFKTAFDKGLYNYPVCVFYDENFIDLRKEKEVLDLISKHNMSDPNAVVKTAEESVVHDTETPLPKNEKSEVKKISIEKYLRNNRYNNDFILSPDGNCYLSFKNGLYTSCSSTWDSWCRITDKNLTASFDPSNPKTIYAINTSYEVYKSVDGGNWIQIQNGLPNGFKPESILINPHNTSDVFLISSSETYRTTDAGFTWKLFNSGNCTLLLIHTLIKDVFYALSKGQLFITYDAGINWKPISNNLPKTLVKSAGRESVSKPVEILSFTMINSPSTTSIIVFTKDGIYKSTNDGEYWTAINEGISESVSISSSFITDNEIFAGGSISKDGAAARAVLFRSDHSLIKWEEVPINDPDMGESVTGIYKNESLPGVIIKTSNDRIAYLNKDSNVIGLNYGVTNHSKVHEFKIANRESHPVQFAIVENNHWVDVENYGLWRSENNGLSWERCILYKSINYFWERDFKKFGVSPHNDLEMWLIDSKSEFVSFDGGNNWMDLNSLYRFEQIHCFTFDPNDKNLVYISDGINESPLFRFDRTTGNMMKIRDIGYGGLFEVSNDNPKNIVTGTAEVTHDGGWTWKSFHDKLDNLLSEHELNINIEQIRPLYYAGNKISLIIKNCIVISEDNGENWQLLKSFDGYIQSVYINPSDINNLVVISKKADSGAFVGLTVSQTFDAINWEPVLDYSIPPSNSPETPVHEKYYIGCFKQQTVNSHNFFIYGTVGLISSINEGKSWQKIGGINENH